MRLPPRQREKNQNQKKKAASYPETGKARPSLDGPSMLSVSGGWMGQKKKPKVQVMT